MEKLPKEVRRRLEDYVSYLDKMIKIEKQGLEYARRTFLPQSMNPDGLTPKAGSVEQFQEAAKPISRIIAAYSDARSEIYILFPELDKKK
jgi:hypothetical protein